MLKRRSDEWHRSLEATTFYTGGLLQFVTRKPVPIISYDQYISGFSVSVWMAILSSLLLFAICFKLFYNAYITHFPPGFCGSLTNPFDFIILTLAGITEPDPLPWFPKWSAAKCLVLFWSILSTFIIFFYTCNLRSRLTAVTYEKPIDNARDVVERGKTVFLHIGLYNYLSNGA